MIYSFTPKTTKKSNLFLIATLMFVLLYARFRFSTFLLAAKILKKYIDKPGHVIYNQGILLKGDDREEVALHDFLSESRRLVQADGERAGEYILGAAS